LIWRNWYEAFQVLSDRITQWIALRLIPDQPRLPLDRLLEHGEPHADLEAIKQRLGM